MKTRHCKSNQVLVHTTYLKSPGAYIFQRSFLRGLLLEGLMYGGKFEFKNRNLPFFFVLLCIWGQFPSTSPLGGLYLEGRFNGSLFALGVWGAYIWRGLFSEFYGTSVTWRAWLSLASQQTSFGVRSSRIHFSPTDVCLTLACVAGVKRGRGRGEFGRALIPFPFPFERLPRGHQCREILLQEK